MQVFTFREHPPRNTVFASGCFDKAIGKHVPLLLDGVRIDDAKILEIAYSDDGKWVDFTVETEEEFVKGGETYGREACSILDNRRD